MHSLSTHRMTFDRKQECPHDIYDGYIERIRGTEYPSLLKTTYLDHAGATLYASSLIDAYHQDLKTHLYGNPHSISPASDLSTQRIDQARLAVLAYFNADPDHFDVVFTANATAAVKLIGDCFRDQNFWYGYHKDAHNSLVGLREVANESRCFTSNEDVDEWIQQTVNPTGTLGLNLFAYPAQSNMTGYRLPLSWSQNIRQAKQSGIQQNTFVLLDAASYLTSGRLNLDNPNTAPDFICLSFYKIFGFPDLGALLVKKSAQPVLSRRKYFGGGTVDAVTVVHDAFHQSKSGAIHDFLEDGTLPFHNIVALSHAIATHKRLFGNAANISKHTTYVSAWLYQRLSKLKHFNGNAVMQMHKDVNAHYGDATTQGPILAFSMIRSDGAYIGKSHIERLAIGAGFQIRTGGVCNPGGIATMIPLEHWEIRRNTIEGGSCGGDADVIGGRPTGIVRVSLGPMSTMTDAIRFAHFVDYFFVESVPQPNPAVALKNTKALTITPIEGCAGITITAIDYLAFEPWNHQWCIIETGNSKKVSPTDLYLLKVMIEPRSGLLRLSWPLSEDLTVSLWRTPQQPTDAPYSTPEVKQFDVYSDTYINNWLTTNLGRPCQLARYRGEDVKLSLEATTCVVPQCTYTRASDKEELSQHYQAHGVEFVKYCVAKNHDGKPSIALDGKHKAGTEVGKHGPVPRKSKASKALGKISSLTDWEAKQHPSIDLYDVKELDIEPRNQGRQSRLRVIVKSMRLKH